MKRTLRRLILLLVVLSIVLPAGTGRAEGPPGWQEETVNFRMSGGSRIKRIYRPVPESVTMLSEYGIQQWADSTSAVATEAGISVNVIDSPPLDGFVPWIAVKATNDTEAGPQDFDAVPQPDFSGTPFTSSFGVGLFDTGAGAHVIGKISAQRLGLTAGSRLTANSVDVVGVTGSVSLRVSRPLGLFVDGLKAVGLDGTSVDTADMVGESNVAVGVTAGVNDPNLITAIGSPMSIFYTTSVRVDTPLARTVDFGGSSRTFTAPDIRFFEHDDPSIPSYANTLPLELKPRGASAVIWIFDLTSALLDPLNFSLEPGTPSIIAGASSQSLYFVHSVDLREGQREARDRERFMLDTGAQVTVISSRIAARLMLDLNNPEFLVDIEGVSGDTVQFPGYTLDALDMPALGQWLSFTNVPVVVLDIASPEGGTLDGIIGMNLFVFYNFVLKGQGFVFENDPFLTFERIVTGELADIAPTGGDGVVNTADLLGLSASWLSGLGEPAWNPRADFAPPAQPDGRIDLRDYAFMKNYWLENVGN